MAAPQPDLPPAEVPAPPHPPATRPPPPRHAGHREVPPGPSAHLDGFLRGRTLLEFGRADNDYVVVDIPVSIDNQNSLSGIVYRQLIALSALELDLTEAQFTRMWKSLILKRVQDIYQKEKKQRHEHLIRLDSSIMVPGPLGDLLFSLGQHISTTNGRVYDITPPPRPAQPPDWWAFDPVIVAGWCRLMYRIKPLYITHEFPSMSDYEGRPLVFTSIQDVGPLRHVKAFSSEPKPSDALLRFLHDDLFNGFPFAFVDCHLIMTDLIHLDSVRLRYVGHFVTGAHS